jgi:esterase/lipase superfamily enzyme
MTLYLNFRSAPVAGSVVYPRLARNGPANPTALTLVDDTERQGLIAGRDILLVVHGFNVNLASGVASAAALDAYLALGDSVVVIGVLWPGDFWIPVVNYPFEGSDAMDCGGKLADYCGRYFGAARSLSFLSHSLGARLVLQAVAALKLVRKARLVCLTAGAINRDCLDREYATAAANSETINVLASHRDRVLELAYPIGDPISNLLHDDHAFFTKALGNDGPSSTSVPKVHGPYQIPDGYNYDHGSYMPSSDPARWPRVADYVRRAFLGQPQVPPPPFP